MSWLWWFALVGAAIVVMYLTVSDALLLPDPEPSVRPQDEGLGGPTG